ncbi:hypothetical protein [Pantoea sp. At-9b]|uniref:hypothetical protein n=1 Tax=Pantoea sp. (strain At-9b) TaxID=592316 RepID=UPI0001B3F507|nr:hypothetical protein [Pantoea sp. At-9b]ADU69475.1 hypothetical protein Pat9b_2163 [Pantoea sp. At-9b]
MHEQTFNFQPVVTLLAAFLGAWLANRNFNKQRMREIENLKENLFEEFRDISYELGRSIAIMVDTYDVFNSGIVNDPSLVRLAKNFDLFITDKVFEKVYSELNRNQRLDIKTLLAMQAFQNERYSFLLDQITNKEKPLTTWRRNELIEFSGAILAYIATFTIAYYYCNALSENRLNYQQTSEKDGAVFNKVMASLKLGLRVQE